MDRRHRWELTSRKGATITHTCRACGKVYAHEALIPDSVISTMVEALTRPNPFRALFGR